MDEIEHSLEEKEETKIHKWWEEEWFLKWEELAKRDYHGKLFNEL